ncbi:hypothetical protein D3C85_1070730 [compost metagenome]
MNRNNDGNPDDAPIRIAHDPDHVISKREESLEVQFLHRITGFFGRKVKIKMTIRLRIVQFDPGILGCGRSHGDVGLQLMEMMAADGFIMPG